MPAGHFIPTSPSNRVRRVPGDDPVVSRDSSRRRSVIGRSLVVLLPILTMLSAATAFSHGEELADAPPGTAVSGATVAQEREVRQRKSITLCIDPDWMPYERIDERGRHIGMSADYMALFEKRIGVPIRLVPTGSWSETIRFGRQGRCDILSLLNETPERRQFLNFTKPYVEAPIVLVSRSDVTYLDGLESLGSRSLSTPKDYVYEETIRREHPQINLVTVANVGEGLRKVSRGDVFAHLGSLYIMVNEIQKQQLSNLKISGHTRYDHRLAVGVRNDDPALLAVFNQAVSSITQEEHIRIRRKWTATRFEYGIDKTLLWRTVAVGLFIIGVILIWNRQLRRLNTRLVESEDRYRVLFEMAPDGLIVHTDGIIRYVNRTMVQMLRGGSEADLLGRPVLEIVHEDYRTIVRDRIEQTQKGSGTIPGMRQQLRALDGRIIDIEAKGRRIFLDGRPASLTILRDISENLRLEGALRAAKENAEVANRAKSRFLAAMSHEIRTPLNAIIGLNEHLWESERLPERRAHLHTILKAGEGLLSLINNVLDVSKIEANQFELETVLFDLPEYLAQTLEIVRHPAEEKGLTLLRTIQADVPREVIGDPQRLRQVILNLIGNAIKFTDRGSVHLEVRRQQRDEILFSVTDTGPGIPAEQGETIFQPFTQLENKTGKISGGTGLGLDICRRLVEMMGGKIWLEPHYGPGSRFSFTARLPGDITNRLPAIAVENQQSAVSPPLKPLRLLLADDDETNREVIKVFLQKPTYRLIEVSDGLAAFETFCSTPFDLVLMDIQMPILDGIGATERIRAWEKSRNRSPTPIIALTAHAYQEISEKILAAGCDLHLTKPIRKKRLLTAIGQLTEESTAA